MNDPAVKLALMSALTDLYGANAPVYNTIKSIELLPTAQFVVCVANTNLVYLTTPLPNLVALLNR